MKINAKKILIVGGLTALAWSLAGLVWLGWNPIEDVGKWAKAGFPVGKQPPPDLGFKPRRIDRKR